MSNNRLVLNTSEFTQALRNLPRELADEAGGIVTGAAESAKSEIVAGYPEVSGNLKRGVVVTHETSAFGARSVVKSRAQHAHLYEYGSQVVRFDRGMSRGKMPGRRGGPLFVPVVVRKRRAMHDALIGLLKRAGFQVSGDV